MPPTETTPLTLEALNGIWSSLIPEERAEAFLALSEEDRERLFAALPVADQADLLAHLPNGVATVWMRFLPPDDAADVLQEANEEQRNRLRTLLDEATRREVDALLAYAEDAAGGLMSPRFVRLRADVTTEVAIRYVRRQTRNKPEMVYYLYVLDAEQHLLGVLSLRELFAAPDDALIEDIMKRDPIAVNAAMDQEEVARIIDRNDLLAVPVLDEQGRMQGIVTVDDVIDVIREEATEDFHKLGGMEALGARYLDLDLLSMVKKRGVWLSVLFIGEMLTATAMGHFEHEIAAAVVLAMFVPLIISSGGNSGSQAATLIVRSLALRDLTLRHWFTVMRRELAAGAALGAWLGLIGFVRVISWQWIGLYDYGPHYILIAVTVWLSLIGVVCFGTLTGSMLPFILRKLGLDPATSSAPFVATLVDVSGLVIYFSIASVILHGTLL